MAATAQLTISSTVQGLPEGSTDHESISLTNSSAVGWTLGATATTLNTTLAGVVSVPTSARFMIIVPTATNSLPIRVGVSSATASMVGAMQLAATGASLMSIVGGSTYYFYTTGATAVPMRVTVY